MLCEVTYPGFPTQELHIIIDNLEAAQLGANNMQLSIAYQYFKKLGRKCPPMTWRWSRMEINEICPSPPR